MLLPIEVDTVSWERCHKRTVAAAGAGENFLLQPAALCDFGFDLVAGVVDFAKATAPDVAVTNEALEPFTHMPPPGPQTPTMDPPIPTTDPPTAPDAGDALQWVDRLVLDMEASSQRAGGLPHLQGPGSFSHQAGLGMAPTPHSFLPPMAPYSTLLYPPSLAANPTHLQGGYFHVHGPTMSVGGAGLHPLPLMHPHQITWAHKNPPFPSPHLGGKAVEESSETDGGEGGGKMRSLGGNINETKRTRNRESAKRHREKRKGEKNKMEEENELLLKENTRLKAREEQLLKELAIVKELLQKKLDREEGKKGGDPCT